MYIDKPLQKRQSISRVKRVFEEKGLVVDYIGFKVAMPEALKEFGSMQESLVDELKISLAVFRELLSSLNKLTTDFDARKFFKGKPSERLICLNAAEFIQTKKRNRVKIYEPVQKIESGLYDNFSFERIQRGGNFKGSIFPCCSLNNFQADERRRIRYRDYESRR